MFFNLGRTRFEKLGMKHAAVREFTNCACGHHPISYRLQYVRGQDSSAGVGSQDALDEYRQVPQHCLLAFLQQTQLPSIPAICEPSTFSGIADEVEWPRRTRPIRRPRLLDNIQWDEAANAISRNATGFI